MEINREKAMDLWKERYGDKKEIKDFSGRTILKGSYGQTGSKYGWNIDHILPKAHGGTNKKGNLIICHIETNAEKGDSYPNFVANDSNWQIVNSNGQYKIIKQNSSEINWEEWNYFQPTKSIKKMLSIYNTDKSNNKNRWCGACRITYSLKNNKEDFLYPKYFEDLLNTSDQQTMFVDEENSKIIHLLSWNNLDTKDKISDILENLVVLNTYLSNLQDGWKDLESFQILFTVQDFKHDYGSGVLSYELLDFENKNYWAHNYSDYPLMINYLVKINIPKAEQKWAELISQSKYYDNDDEWYEYDVIKTQLDNNLKNYFKD
ncbi:HNH endonuclease domain-containing protein [Ureaplasma ceti]|uniref:HNH nuclease domain-containing protein n=1 Tax=Ureaplasma ceti TaxID=3119530 RepID=A0ABP9U6G0_9BACT